MKPAAFVLSAFSAPDAVGNPTGVVLLDAAPDPVRAQWVAAHLGFPDTVFSWLSARGREARFYSPTEPLSVCYQALLAAAAVLDTPSVEFTLEDRAIVVERADGAFWARTPRSLVRREGEIDTPLGRGQVVDAGRRRAYLQVDAERFGAASWDPDEALHWLRASPLTGVCLLHVEGPGAARLRVFTSSLGGREDVATGGAAVGVPVLLGADRAWRVKQGLGPALRRAELLARTEGDAILVGGRVNLLFAGTLEQPI